MSVYRMNDKETVELCSVKFCTSMKGRAEGGIEKYYQNSNSCWKRVCPRRAEPKKKIKQGRNESYLCFWSSLKDLRLFSFLTGLQNG